MIAQRIRDFIDSLFPNRVVLLLRRQMEEERRLYELRIGALSRGIIEREEQILEARRERDYFRGRAERLELRLLPDPVARDKKINTGEPVRMGGQKTWPQVQRENAENIRRANEEAERKKRQDEERADAPKPLEQIDAASENVAAAAAFEDR